MAQKFSLQPVLDYRHNHVEALEIELGILLASHQRNRLFLDELYRYQGSIFEDLHLQQDGEINLSTINNLRSNLKAVENRIHQQIALLAELKYQIEKKRCEIVEARQDEETLVKLKEKENERYMVEQAQHENRLQDDIYISQAFRRSNGSH